ncbi:MAG: FBox-LRR protein [Harvfovirus sp.]|uniref:FBox-LRR protein n=1 Tax=Harvfovirus sp. TaxID=2487768 RepID=A0A3G5A609_9VIRU|nr:MAG: FBox-LRR protein [Harvfovirus sp.]
MGSPETKITLFGQPLPTDIYYDPDEKYSKDENKLHRKMTFTDDFDINSLEKYIHVHPLSNGKIDPVQLLKPIDEDFLCNICCYVNSEPYSLPCNHVFCLYCINKFDNESCPLCRVQFDKQYTTHKTDLALKISTIQFNCSLCCKQHAIGIPCQTIWTCIFCTLQVENKKIYDHLQKDCDDMSTLTKCTLCNKDCFSFHLPSHKKYFCKHRPTECTYCTKVFPHNILPKHTPICKKNSNAIINCKYCKHQFSRKDLTTHSPACPEKPSTLRQKCKHFFCC